jgi:hypothetical protein
MQADRNIYCADTLQNKLKSVLNGAVCFSNRLLWDLLVASSVLGAEIPLSVLG